MLRDQCSQPGQECLLIPNAFYRPDLQAAELFWAQCKRRYRNAITVSYLNNEPIEHEELVEGIMESIPTDMIKRMCDNTFERIENAKPVNTVGAEGYLPDHVIDRIKPEIFKAYCEPEAAEEEGEAEMEEDRFE